MEHEDNDDSCCDWHTWNHPKKLGKGSGRVENQTTSGHHPDNSIVEISQNTEKSSGDLRRLAVTQTPVKNYQLTLV